jgi:hypothetical protein
MSEAADNPHDETPHMAPVVAEPASAESVAGPPDGNSSRPAGSKGEGKPKARRRKAGAATTPGESPDSAAAETGRKARKVRGKRRQDLNQALVFELRTLRASLARTLESIEIRLGGRITEMLHAIEGEPGLDQKPGPLTVKTAQAALAQIEALRIKPKRGRIKDIRRIEKTLRAIQEPHTRN